MDDKTFKSLKRGDIVRSLFSGTSYVVDANFGNRVTATKTADLTDPKEWELIEGHD